MSSSSNQQNCKSQRVPDLVRDSQLTTRFLPSGATQHTVYRVSHQSRHRRPARINETWHRQQELGHGSFGCVWLERCASGPAEGKLRAVKEIRKDPSLPVSYSRELEAMAKFSHERYVHCFVECYGWYESENMVFIAMQYIEYGDLQNYLNQPFSEAHAKVIASQLIEGLGYMHENGFAHRDLKPKNILVYQPGPDWWVKIGDLGISKRAEQEGTALRTVIGTEGYVAPEVIGFVHAQSWSSSDAFSYTFAVDMWALGELLFRMIAQRPVFPNRPDLFNHVSKKHPFPIPTLKAAGASQDCCNFISKCMAVEPNRRLKASEAAAHPWVQTWWPPSRSSGCSSPTRGREVPPPIPAKVPMWPATPNPQPVVHFEDTAQWSTASQEPQDRWLTSIQIGATHKELQQPQVELPTTSIRGTFELINTRTYRRVLARAQSASKKGKQHVSRRGRRTSSSSKGSNRSGSLSRVQEEEVEEEGDIDIGPVEDLIDLTSEPELTKPVEIQGDTLHPNLEGLDLGTCVAPAAYLETWLPTSHTLKSSRLVGQLPLQSRMAETPEVTVAVRLGKRFTAVGLLFPNGRLHFLDNWPGGNIPEINVPTRLVYNHDNSVSSWGFQCDVIDPTLLHGKTDRRLFTMFLDQATQEEAIQGGLTHGLPSRAEAARCITDYLREIYRHVKNTYQGMTGIQNWTDSSVKFLFSVPTTWKGMDVINTFKATIQDAGFGSEGARHTAQIDLTEAEAAVVDTLKSGVVNFRTGDIFLSVDAGSGTTDLSLVRTTSVDNGIPQISQIAEVSGIGIGSFLIDCAFEGLVEQRLAANPDVPYIYSDGLAQRMMRSDRFKITKHRFGEPGNLAEVHKIPMPNVPHQFSHNGLRAKGACMLFDNNEIQALFDPYVRCIIAKIQEQLNWMIENQCNKQVKCMILSGGLGSSAYVQQCIREHFSHFFIIPNQNHETTIVRGLLQDHKQRMETENGPVLATYIA